MRRNSGKVAGGVLALLLALCLSACQRQAVYSHYEHTPLAGWEKNDTLLFLVPPMAEAGTYEAVLGMRTDTDFPFQSLSLIVEQTIMPRGERHFRQVTCTLIDKNGRIKGDGVGCFQYEFPLEQLTLDKGDSLRITVRHNMKREIMPGVSSLGVVLRRSAGR